METMILCKFDSFLMKSAEAEGDCDVTRNNNHFADFFTAQKSLGCLNYAA